MAKSAEDRLNDAVGTVAQAAREFAGGSVIRVSIDLQASGELPYRVDTPDEQYPLVGLARIEPEDEDQSTTVPSVAESQREDSDRG